MSLSLCGGVQALSFFFQLFFFQGCSLGSFSGRCCSQKGCKIFIHSNSQTSYMGSTSSKFTNYFGIIDFGSSWIFPCVYALIGWRELTNHRFHLLSLLRRFARHQQSTHHLLYLDTALVATLPHLYSVGKSCHLSGWG